MPNPRHRARQWLGLAILVPVVGLLMFMSLRWSDTSDQDQGVVEFRFEGITHSRTRFRIEVSTLDGTRVLQVGDVRIWILGDRVVFPASMVGADGSHLSLPIGSLSPGWRALQATDPEIDFDLDPREGRYASDRELDVLKLVLPSDQLDPPIELVGRSVFVERREPVTTLLRVVAGSGDVWDMPPGYSISPVPEADVGAVAARFEEWEPLVED